ncbi:ArsR/SmtB family transcription factor [Streptosporangium sandarakinum]|uniref:ArsR/SmtB family transcription factor n=1 Tax=Streptosporangium sandarakinum TaxID=1260955 RepID=UPI00371EC65E
MRTELAFSTGDLAHTRFAVSPMWEVVTSFRVLAGPSVPEPHRPWAEQVLPRLRAAGLDRGRLARLVPATGYLADFLTPTPATPFPTLEAELAAIRATSAEQARRDLAVLAAERTRQGPGHPAVKRDPGDPAAGRPRRGSGGPAVVPSRRDPAEDLDRVTAEIETYWELALAPYWARIRATLEADVFHRARQVAEYGAAHLLNDLHASVSWGDDTLRLVRRHCTVTREHAGPGLVLLPSVFSWPHVLTRVAASEPLQIAYPARGFGSVWERRVGADADAMAAVLGRSRALLLAELESPASTTQLARRSGLSAAGVSQHLTVLRDAGLVTAHRAGRSVLYARTAVADSLLAAAPA